MQNKIEALARPEIVAMKAFSSARSESVVGDIWMDANENPWNESFYNRYPEPQPDLLRSALANIYNVKSDQLLITRGSDEGVDLLIRLFCRAGQDKIMLCPPTYGMYSVAATVQGADIVEVPLIKSQNFKLDVNSVFKQWQPTIKIVFLCSPNNPTGNVFAIENLLSICKQLTDSIIVIDEAYIEFSNAESMLSYLDDYPNLVVLRTLSKAYGLAGIRCGITLANSNIIALLKKIIAPYPIPRPIAKIASERLSFDIQDQIKNIHFERDKLYQFLSNLPWVKKVWKSDANFLLFEVDDAKTIIAKCLTNGIVLRDRSSDYQLNNCIRVTVGLAAENALLMEVLNRA